jgi:hypothetical protein
VGLIVALCRYGGVRCPSERYPMQVVCAWIGATVAVAAEHYLQVTEAHDEQAARIPAESADRGCLGGTANPAETPKIRRGTELQRMAIADKTSDYPQGNSNEPEKSVGKTRDGDPAAQIPAHFGAGPV